MSRAQVRTMQQDGTKVRYLGEIAPVSGLRYSFTLPGGCESMSCVLGAEPTKRDYATDPGRLVDVLLGGSVVWQGIMTEPVPDTAGWQLAAIGGGNWGALYRATYSASWASSVPDAVINNAIGRGLLWQISNIGSPGGMFTGQASDSGSMAIDEVLNQLTQKGNLTWQVKLTPGGHVPQMFAVPSTPNSLLIADEPAARTLGGDINAICIRYQSGPDLNGAPAPFSTTFVTDADSIAKHGRMETFLDLSSVGQMPLGDAQAVGNGILTRYQRAQYAGPFSVRHGQLLTLGGQPRDLGVFYGPENGMCCKLILADQGFGGEVTASTPVFAVGRYEYDDDTETATVEPFNSIRADMSALMDERAGMAHARRIIRRIVDGITFWRWEGRKRWHQGPPPKARGKRGPIVGRGDGPKHHRRAHAPHRVQH